MSLFDKNRTRTASAFCLSQLDLSDCDFEGEGDGGVLDAQGEIAKYLPMGCNVSEWNLHKMAVRVSEGELTAQEAAQRLSSKKIIIKKK
jgi:hypothetical protein